MRSTLLSLMTVLGFLAGVCQSEARLTNSIYGFYWTAYPGAGCFATNVSGFQNLSYIQWNKADADQIIASNSKLLIDTTWVFYNGNPGLNPDYQATWNAVKAQLTPHYLSQIAAFYVMDEPYWAHGLTPAELQTAVACIKADFPTIPVAVTFAYPSVNNFTDSSWIPTNLDWISFDQYNNFGAISGLLSKIETYKQPNQKIFLTTQGFRSGMTDATVADWNYDYHDLYLSDPEIFGQLSFLCRGSREYVFPTDGAMPLTYSVQQSIGTEVLKMGNSFKRSFSDMFESAASWATNWPSLGTWTRSTTRVRTGTYAAKLSGLTLASSLTSRAMSVSDAKKASVNFWWFIHGLTSGEYVRCEIKLDNGAWIQKASLDGGGSMGDQWLHVTASDIDLGGATNLYLRFRGAMSSSSKYACVDSVNVCRWADPVVATWPTATTITNGQPLNTSILSGGSASPGGSFAWSAPLSVPNQGMSTQYVTFTPNDTVNYNCLQRGASLRVMGTPGIARWPTASPITYGQALNASSLSSGSASPSGAFSWTAPATLPGAGMAQQSVTFTPSDTTNYHPISGNVSVTVNKATPTLYSWPTATPITYGQTLASSLFVGGSVTPAGTFSWTNPTNAPGSGTAPQSVRYTPIDTANYGTLNLSVNVTVNPAASSTTITSSRNPATNGVSVQFSASVTSGAGTPSGQILFLTNDTPLATVALVGGSASYGTTNFPVGSTQVEARYTPQANWLGSSQTLTQVVYGATPTTNFWTCQSGGNASGHWPAATNWNNLKVPQAGDTADFSTLSLTSDSIISLDGNQLINFLTFGNRSASPAASWTLSPGIPTSSTLSLSGTAPTLTVYPLGSGKTATISAAISGTSGFTLRGGGTLVLSGENPCTGPTLITAGTLQLSGSISNQSELTVTSGAALQLLGGRLATGTVRISTNASLTGFGTITGVLVNDGTVIADGGTNRPLAFNGPVTNNSTMRISAGTPFTATGPFVNNGILDIINAAGSLPPGFVNHGVVLDSASVRILGLTLIDHDVRLRIQSTPGHTYQLQRANAIDPAAWLDSGATQPGTGGLLDFTNSATITPPGVFYRFRVN